MRLLPSLISFTAISFTAVLSSAHTSRVYVPVGRRRRDHGFHLRVRNPRREARHQISGSASNRPLPSTDPWRNTRGDITFCRESVTSSLLLVGTVANGVPRFRSV